MRLVLLVAVFLAFAGTAQANPWIEKRAPLNIAHQGGEDDFPSNTLYAFRHALRAGADMLELDIGVTRDGKVVVMHDTTVNRTTNGRGTIASKTLKQIKRLDAAYWFAPNASDHYSHDLRRRAYRFRGAGLRVPTLRQVLRAFPHTPVNIEIKGRTPDEETQEYVKNAEVLARLLRRTKRRDLIVTSFQQAAVDRFHALVPRIDVAPGIDGVVNWAFAGGSPGPGVAAFQLPITYRLGGNLIDVTTPDNVARAHGEGYAWHTWFSNDDRDRPASWRRLIDMCVDGIMTSRPRKLELVLRRNERPEACR